MRLADSFFLFAVGRLLPPEVAGGRIAGVVQVAFAESAVSFDDVEFIASFTAAVKVSRTPAACRWRSAR